jgi:hypothetical protein
MHSLPRLFDDTDIMILSIPPSKRLNDSFRVDQDFKYIGLNKATPPMCCIYILCRLLMVTFSSKHDKHWLWQDCKSHHDPLPSSVDWISLVACIILAVSPFSQYLERTASEQLRLDNELVDWQRAKNLHLLVILV